MAGGKRRGPTKGGRVLVKLPFGKTLAPTNKSRGLSQLVLVKEGVADYLKLKPVDKIPSSKVTFKTAAGSRTVDRVKNVGSYRGESVTLIFGKPQSIKGSSGSYKTVSLPLGSGCNITDAVEYFQSNFPNIVGLRTRNGHRIQWGVSK
ncbi:hypothetical protein [Nodularia sphaerocarpa]|uniref:hypothetical protein n=1 Tax=Nodularia sphaerocarpa TaxID=137816 RepID=UPI001EFC0575|nr:hypothetical protein [Nodularia sphaerocarpa]MDB9374308.1 hypothetical protein [Nodularia sphaerocarpa CS-585]MDB9376464.1 hypothetical protein [Nodularia sphaerocarpa CS-585A2]ULP74144.1 hypothetical protein BDGGKGIB_03807 [Nodularia sphaerocarpa UHCC 0038]